MGKTKVVESSLEQRAALEKGYAKHEWLEPTDYGSFSKFRKKIYYIFDHVGAEYQVSFKEMHHST
jgi:hypothetical protein